MFEKLDEKYGNGAIWQFIKFNLVSFSVTAVQLFLCNLLPLFFDSFAIKLPEFLRTVFKAEVLFDGSSKYVIDGAVTWGYVLPFFLSNLIANIYGYFVNMKTTFNGKGTKAGLLIYFAVMSVLILFTTWLQGYITSLLSKTTLAYLARTIAAFVAGLLQVVIIFPLEKYVLFKPRD